MTLNNIGRESRGGKCTSGENRGGRDGVVFVEVGFEWDSEFVGV